MYGVSEKAHALDGVHVLVVDDSDDEREMLAFVLGASGARVTAVASAAAALATIRREPPDALVSDISLPEMDGHGFIRRLRASDPEDGGRIPAVALSGWGGFDEGTQSIDSGFQAYLSKPVEIDTLVAVVAGLAAAGENARERVQGCMPAMPSATGEGSL
jgi:CheY-like chemotaxis protein